jgi:hypothetical protein
LGDNLLIVDRGGLVTASRLEALAEIEVRWREIGVACKRTFIALDGLRVRPRSLSRITKLSQHESDGR